MTALSAEQALNHVRTDGAIVVDVREPDAFCSGHPSGAINVRFSSEGLAERVASVVPAGPPIIVLAADDGEATDAERQLALGGRSCLGRADGTPAAWANAGSPWVMLEQISSDTLSDDPTERRWLVLDVREPFEWELGCVPGAVRISLRSVRERMDELQRDAEIAVICEAGVRSASAASVLQAAGFERLANVSDGTAGYRKAGRPLEDIEDVEV